MLLIVSKWPWNRNKGGCPFIMCSCSQTVFHFFPPHTRRLLTFSCYTYQFLFHISLWPIHHLYKRMGATEWESTAVRRPATPQPTYPHPKISMTEVWSHSHIATMCSAMCSKMVGSWETKFRMKSWFYFFGGLSRGAIPRIVIYFFTVYSNPQDEIRCVSSRSPDSQSVHYNIVCDCRSYVTRTHTYTHSRTNETSTLAHRFFFSPPPPSQYGRKRPHETVIAW